MTNQRMRHDGKTQKKVTINKCQPTTETVDSFIDLLFDTIYA